MKHISQALPLLDDLKKYNRQIFKHDLMAGLTVAIMLIPQGMAYALLAGLPAIYGFYAAFIPLAVYPLFGSSRQLSVGPVALVSIMVLTGISEFATPGSPEFIEYALLTALVAGFIQLLLALFRMGFLVNFLSEPVISGFTAAAALIISLSQLKYLLGIEMGRSANIIQLFDNLFAHIEEVHGWSLLLGGLAIFFILFLKKVKRSLPGALLAIMLSTAAVYLFRLDTQNIDILKEVPGGLPTITTDFIAVNRISEVLPLALAICLVSFIESLAIAKTIAAKHGNYPIDANKELLGLGLAKIIGSFFLAFPNTGSFTRSAINDEAGARSGMASIYASVFIGVTLLLLTPLFYYLPKPVLAAIVVAAVAGLIDIPYAKELYRVDRKDFYVFLATFMLTLLLGVQQGVFSGIILSVLMILYKSSRPHYAVLGRLPGTKSYRNIKRYPDIESIPGTLIIRYDDDVYFGNADHFYDSIIKEIKIRESIHTIILNASAISRIDSTGLHKLRLLLDTLRDRNVKLLLTNLRGPVRDLLAATGICDQIGYENSYLSIEDAVEGHTSPNGIGALSRKYAAQRNKDISK